MRRNGFTMVELIFVIIIIGILSVAAIPKFGDIKDRAKVNSEYSALSGLQSAITAKMEFTMEDQNNIAIDWHNTPFGTHTNTTYQKVNTNKKVLSAVAKKSDSLRLVKFVNLDSTGTVETDNNVTYDVLFIEGASSNHITGVEKSTDVAGRPDKNDVWAFNASPIDITIVYYNSTLSGEKKVTKVLHSGDIALIDNQGIKPAYYEGEGQDTSAVDADGDIAVFKTSDMTSSLAITDI